MLVALAAAIVLPFLAFLVCAFRNARERRIYANEIAIARHASRVRMASYAARNWKV